MSNQRYAFHQESLSRLDFNLLYISTSKYEGEWQSHPHTHHFSELFYVLSGKGSFQVNDTLLPLRQDDFIIVNPHVEHTEKSVDSSPLEYVVFGIEGLSFQFHEKMSCPHDYAIYNYTAGQRDKLLYFLKILVLEMEEKEKDYETICRNITEVLLLYLSRSRCLNLVTSLDAKMSKECGLIKRYIDSNYAESITLDFLSALTHINKYYLVHSFTRYTGLSPINYLIQKRVQVAMDLLSSTNYSIAQISSSVGFSSQSYFSQAFKKASGLTPIQYRKQNFRD